MDGREGMALSGATAAYYLNRAGVSGSGSGSGSGITGGAGIGGLPGPHAHAPAFKPLSNPNVAFQPINIGAAGVNPSQSFGHGVSVAVASPVTPGDPVKKKRGRPRKYAPDGANMSLGLSPLMPRPSSGSLSSPGPKRPRGRPPGTGWKQQLAPLGEWMNNSAGMAFTPHVIHVGVGEDVASKIMAFAQQKPRALCILSGHGLVSAVTLRQPVTSSGAVTYEGRFQILCLSGSYLVPETGSPRNRVGGLSISVCSHDGHVFGGAIGGRLIAANPVQVVVCSFIYGGKAKNKPEASTKYEHVAADLNEKSITPISGAGLKKDHNPNSLTVPWPPGPRPNSGNSQTGIDLTRG